MATIESSTIRDLTQAARAQGWRIRRTTRSHYQFIPPDRARPIVVVGGTPSDHHSLGNFLAALRRQGFVWPWKGH